MPPEGQDDEKPKVKLRQWDGPSFCLPKYTAPNEAKEDGGIGDGTESARGQKALPKDASKGTSQPATVAIYVPEPGKQPWDRLTTETLRAYRAFCLYRNQGPLRTYSKVVTTGRVALARIQEYRAKFSWAVRVAAWDDHLEDVARKEFERERIEAARRQARLGVMMQGVAVEGLEYLEPQELEAGEIARLAETGVRIERLARGDSTDNVAEQGKIVFELPGGVQPSWMSGAGTGAATKVEKVEGDGK